LDLHAPFASAIPDHFRPAPISTHATQPSPQRIRLHEAMATGFEVRVAAVDADYASQAV
jgi:hypothetical protein